MVSFLLKKPFHFFFLNTSDIFAMVMFVDITDSSVPFAELQKQLAQEGESLGLVIHAMHEDIFRAMHEI